MLLALPLVARRCGNNGGNNSSGDLQGNQGNPPQVIRTPRRGLPGEPQTLDPQLADDTPSFQVVRDLYCLS
jgi:hypothetical protein